MALDQTPGFGFADGGATHAGEGGGVRGPHGPLAEGMGCGVLLHAGGADGDARVVQVGLTRAGLARWQRMDAALRRHAEGALSRLSAEERRTVHRGLALLLRALEGDAIARPENETERCAARPRSRALAKPRRHA